MDGLITQTRSCASFSSNVVGVLPRMGGGRKQEQARIACPVFVPDRCRGRVTTCRVGGCPREPAVCLDVHRHLQRAPGGHAVRPRRALASWSDPGEPGGKPKEIQKIKVIFNPGTKLDTRALPTCNASRGGHRGPGRAGVPREDEGWLRCAARASTRVARLSAPTRRCSMQKGAIDRRRRRLTMPRAGCSPTSGTTSGRARITVNLKIGKGILLIRFPGPRPRALPQAGQACHACGSAPGRGAWNRISEIPAPIFRLTVIALPDVVPEVGEQSALGIVERLRRR